MLPPLIRSRYSLLSTEHVQIIVFVHRYCVHTVTKYIYVHTGTYCNPYSMYICTPYVGTYLPLCTWYVVQTKMQCRRLTVQKSAPRRSGVQRTNPLILTALNGSARLRQGIVAERGSARLKIRDVAQYVLNTVLIYI
jgi:hypothetical protein